MAKKDKTYYVCSECGHDTTKWSGKCENCGAWNTLTEFHPAKLSLGDKSASGIILDPDASSQGAESTIEGLKTGINFFDNVLGGQVVAGSVILLAGQPGMGKSTLLTQITASVSETDNQILYVSAEESVHQVSTRIKRLTKSEDTKLNVVHSTGAEDIMATIASAKFKLIIVDSIQTIANQEASGLPGSVSQITSSTAAIISAAKNSNTSVILVGHVTKEGNIAGPKLLEHLVDVVLYLDGERTDGFKFLRGIKNRYGSTNEVAVLEMDERGLSEVLNPSEALLSERQTSDGSVIFAAIEGNRPILVEVQALVHKTNFGYPKRTASGFDLNRLQLLVAVISRRTKLNLSEYDIYINFVGGFKITEPAADLAVAMAIASAASGRELPDDLVVFGEVGLSGEIRRAVMAEKRVSEAKKMGFKAAVGPASNAKKDGTVEKFIKPVKNIREAFLQYLE
jgi:DNA repair protein RadA/Sms